MANEKLISQISTIQRALGMIEGISYGLTMEQGNAIDDAVQMIDETVQQMIYETTKGMMEDGK